MLKALPHLAQDPRESALLLPQRQSRAAGSCMGAIETSDALSANFGKPPNADT